MSPEHFLSNFIISLREKLKSEELSREDVLWRLTTALLTIESAIAGLIQDGMDTPDIPDGWPPDER
jgi:hypothetical protein